MTHTYKEKIKKKPNDKKLESGGEGKFSQRIMRFQKKKKRKENL